MERCELALRCLAPQTRLFLTTVGDMDTKQSKAGQIAEWLTSAFILLAMSTFTPVMLLAVNAQRGAEPRKFLLVAAGAFVIGTLIALVLSLWVGHRRAVAVAAVLLWVFFSWSELQSLTGRISFSRPGFQVVLTLLVLALFVAVAYRFAKHDEFRLVVAVAGVALVLTPLWTLLQWYAGEPAKADLTAAVQSENGGQRPDLYFLVLDGYARSDILDDLYGFSNDAFLEELARRGFVVPESSHANYSMTAASLSSTLALDYLVPESVVPDHRLRLALYEVIRGDNPVVEALRSAGYRYIHIEGGWDGSRCGDNADDCYPAGFVDEASWTLLARTPLFPFLRTRYGSAFAVNGMRVFKDLASEVSKDRDQPRFVFAHVILPHPPLYLSRDCAVRPEPEPGGGAVGARFLAGTTELDKRRSAYVEQVECVNGKVLSFLDLVDDDTLVFITGDHGPDSFGQLSVPPEDWTAADIRERFAVMSAYRSRPECETRLQADIDLITGMRVMVDCALGTELPSLPSHAFIFPTPDGAPYPTTSVELATLGD